MGCHFDQRNETVCEVNLQTSKSRVTCDRLIVIKTNCTDLQKNQKKTSDFTSETGNRHYNQYFDLVRYPSALTGTPSGNKIAPSSTIAFL